MRARARARARVTRAGALTGRLPLRTTYATRPFAPLLRAVVGVAGAPSGAIGFGVQRVAPHPDHCERPQTHEAPVIHASLFAHEQVSVPSSRKASSFAELVALIGPPRPAATKKGIPLYSPAEWPEGAAKTKAGVLRVHFGVLDFDDVPEDDLARLLASLSSPYMLASSWHHGGVEGAVRARLVVPFTRPVEAAEWPRFWEPFSRVVGGGLSDQSCKDSSRCYWVPSHPLSPPAEPLYLYEGAGEPVDVDALLRASVPALGVSQGTPAGAPQRLTRDDLQAIASKKARAKSEKVKALAEPMRCVIRGESFAKEGERDTTLFKICCAIVEAHPFVEPESVADLFEPSLLAMGPDAPTRADVIEKVTRKGTEPREALGGRISDVWAGKRKEPYDAEEIRCFEDQLGGQMRSRWIIQRGRSYYVWTGLLGEEGRCTEGRYRGPYSGDDLQNAARRLLSPGAPWGIEFDVSTQTSTRAKSVAELVRDYGTVAESVRVDLTADFSYYDSETDTFTEAPTPLRRLEPRFDPQIDAWFRVLAGPHYDSLNAWCAASTMLREPCAALYLEGPKGTGKSLLAMGLSRLWTLEGPTDLEEALAPFNEAILQCPLIFGDEVVPSDWRGRAKTGEIREFIQARVRSLKRKYMPTAKVYGCVRMVLAANNLKLLDTRGDETNNDIAAIVERFYYLPVASEAAEYLGSLPRRTVQSWVENDLLARHALHLRDAVPISRASRFLVSGHASDLVRSMTVNAGLRSAVCHWLVSFLLDQSRLNQSPNRSLIRVYQGSLAVNARVMLDHWQNYSTHEDPPPAGRLAQALAGISSQRVHLRDARGHEVWYRLIDTENLVTWAENTGFATRDTVASILAKNSG